MSSNKYIPLYEIALDKIKVISYENNIENDFKRLKRNLNDIEDSWSGESYNSFISAIEDLEKDVRDLVNNINTLESEVGKAYSNTQNIIEEERRERLKKLQEEIKKKMEGEKD